MKRGLLLLIAILCHGCSASPEDVTLTGLTMGTTYTIRLVGCTAECAEALADSVDHRLAELTARLSHYEPDSEVSRFNRSRATQWVPVSADLAFVAGLALDIAAKSDGAFDITVAPAVDAWGFGPADRAPSALPPGPESLARLGRRIDFRKLEVGAAGPALRKTDPDVALDLSGIAKGYAVDQLALLIESRGIRDYLVEIGGELRAAGVRADGRPWRAGIEEPDSATQIRFVVTVSDTALATSGDYRNFREIDGIRVGHTLDPRTARPVDHELASASVIAPDAAQADAIATVLMVLGPERARAWAVANDIAALLITRTGDGTDAWATPAFESRLLRR